LSVEEKELPDGSIDDCRIRLGSSDVYESCHDKPGELFRDLQKQYGRCTSRVYVGDGKPIGWVFQKKVPYTDRWSKPGEVYDQETWVTVHSGPPTKTVEYHYAELE
jgi:hypothetical protein